MTINNFRKKIRNIIKNPKLILFYLDKNDLLNLRIDDKSYISILYEKSFNKKMNWEKPKTFNEKLQWLKLNDRKNEYTKMVDKYEAKKYVASIIGKEYIIPTIKLYDKFDEIDFDKLPNQFVMKCTHDSGGLIICKDKSLLNINKAKRKLNKCLKHNYYYNGREWPYKNVKPRILVEPYFENKQDQELRDYKFFCFNGQAKIFKIDFNRATNHQANYYDLNGNLLHFGEVAYPPDFKKKIPLPKNLNRMIKLAETLSKDTLFLRVDFYEVDNKIYLGELTFYPMAGFGKFTDEKWDKILGDWIQLPIDKQ